MIDGGWSHGKTEGQTCVGRVRPSMTREREISISIAFREIFSIGSTPFAAGGRTGERSVPLAHQIALLDVCFVFGMLFLQTVYLNGLLHLQEHVHPLARQA